MTGADPRAIAALRPVLLAYARRLRLDPWAAEDLVQTALCRAIGKRHLWAPTAPLISWLTTILRNEYVTGIRRAVHQIVEIGGAEGVAAAGTPEAAAYAGEVVAALRRLTRDKQDAVRLLADGWSYEDAARLLAVPVGTVRSRASRGRAELRDMVEVERL